MLSKTIEYALFPTVMASCISLAYWASLQAFEHGLIIGGCSFIALLTIAIAERVQPFRYDWNQSQGDIITDIWHNLLSSYGSRELYKLIAKAIIFGGIVNIAESQQGLWPADWPLWLDVIAVALLAEFGTYWVHRISHEVDFFWRFHSIHHCAGRLYWLNAGRDHPVSVFFLFIASSLPLILLGIPAEALLIYYVIEAVHGLFQHCNIRLTLGPLNWIFSMAELHRWHHSTKVKEANHNYGLTLIFWDIVFSTRYLPDLNGPKNIGIHGREFPKSFWKQMLVPFKW